MSTNTVMTHGEVNATATLALLTVNELREVWSALAGAAKRAGLDVVALRRRVMDRLNGDGCPAESIAIYAVRDFASAIYRELIVTRCTGRKVLETRFGGERVLVDECVGDGSRGAEVVRSVLAWW